MKTFRRNPQAGFISLLEMMLVLVILSILACMAAVNVVQVNKYASTKTARTRVLWVWQAEGSYLTCMTLTPTQCGPLSSMLPAFNTPTVMDAYSYTLTGTSTVWTYTATATRAGLTSPIVITNAGMMTCAGQNC